MDALRPYKRSDPPSIPGSDKLYLDGELRRIEQASGVSTAALDNLRASLDAVVDIDGPAFALGGYPFLDQYPYLTYRYRVLRDEQGIERISIGDSTDQVNYYSGAAHVFYSIDYSTYYGTIGPNWYTPPGVTFYVDGPVEFANSTTAPTKALGTSTTDVATTAFVENAKIKFAATVPGGSQTVSGGAYTKLNFTTETYDIGSYYDAANAKWTPPAGKYFISCRMQAPAGSGGFGIVLYKNGAYFKGEWTLSAGTTVSNFYATLSMAVEANGTDYFEMYIYPYTAGSWNVGGEEQFEGFRI